jgi:hypothetical protein
MGKQKRHQATISEGQAAQHQDLVNNNVHVFVDDQNLFYGITNDKYGKDFRIDFGQLMIAACRNSKNESRGVGTAYIAGVIPDCDSFWQAAQDKGWEVKRGYLGSGGRSKQDDAYIIAEIVETIYTKEGPSTIVLVAGDADYVPPVIKALEKGWRVEIAFIDRGLSEALKQHSHQLRTINPLDIQYKPEWRR